MDDKAKRLGPPRTQRTAKKGRVASEAGRAAAAESEAEREAAAEIASGPEVEAAPAAPDDVIKALRGVRIAATRAIALSAASAPASRGPSAAVLAATLFLVGSAVLSVSFMLTRGGLSIALRTPEPSAIAAPSDTPTPPTPTPAPSPTTTPLVTLAPTAVPTPAPPTPTPDPRLALLEPCPDTPDCYLYTVRQDDSLARISGRFSIPVATILELNPWIVDPSIIHRGEVLVLPPPG